MDVTRSYAKVGRVSNRALKVYIYTLDKVLVKEFTSKKFFGELPATKIKKRQQIG